MPSSTPSKQPVITVLLAAYNGARWLDEQLDSILAQRGVDVRILALDDGSTDETPQLLAARAAADSRLTVLPSPGPSGGAAANFYRLIRAVDVQDAGLIALADQDDVWLQGKLERHAELLASGADGVSSNVTAFSERGPRRLVRKNYPQRTYDYLLEAPGPGCTFLMSPRLVASAQRVLKDESSEASGVHLHDWLIYVICRAQGWRWIIDAVPSVDYRQHGNNVMGANLGPSSARKRLGMISNRWHRHEATLLSRVALEVAPDELRPGLETMNQLLTNTDTRSRAALVRRAGQLRRRPRDRAIVGTLVALRIW